MGPLLPSVVIDSERLANGTEFALVCRGEEWIVRVNDMVLMSSRAHASEDALAERALERVVAPGDVLVGGLGLGYTLRAVLDRVSAETRVTVAELVRSLVSWNQDHVGALADHPLSDPRTHVVVGDVFDQINGRHGAFDVILLDVDNGPATLSNASNQCLYGRRGVRACFEALRPKGILAVWSVGPNARFERALRGAGFEVEVRREQAFTTGSSSHVVFLALRGSDASPAGSAVNPSRAHRRAKRR